MTHDCSRKLWKR